MNQEDRSQLHVFVDRTEVDLSQAIEYVPEDDLRELAFAAFRDALEGGEFNRLHTAIESRDFDQRLDDFGLSGTQLQFKLAVIEQRRQQVYAAQQSPQEPDEPLAPEEPPAPQERPRRGRRLRRLLSKLLGAINTVLDSLVDALQGIGELLKELKQALEKLLED